MSDIDWTYKPFGDLTSEDLYQILTLRNKVFVVEQNCVYADTDGKDLSSFHLYGKKNNVLVAYARILPPQLAFEEASIGRVVTDPQYRRSGIGKELMEVAIEKTFNQFNVNSIRIGAQKYLLEFYKSLGFRTQGEIYLEDGIPHVEMILSK